MFPAATLRDELEHRGVVVSSGKEDLGWLVVLLWQKYMIPTCPLCAGNPTQAETFLNCPEGRLFTKPLILYLKGRQNKTEALQISS